MIALVMCGGRGKRLGMGEKCLVRVGDKRLIDYVLDELWFLEVYGVTTEFTPMTEEYLKSQGIRCIRTSGRGFVEDMREAVVKEGLFEPILVTAGDLVILKRGLMMEVVEFYNSSNLPALRVESRGKPVGINVIDGYFYDTYQEEAVMEVEDEVININTPKDLIRAICLIRSRRRGGEWLRG